MQSKLLQTGIVMLLLVGYCLNIYGQDGSCFSNSTVYQSTSIPSTISISAVGLDGSFSDIPHSTKSAVLKISLNTGALANFNFNDASADYSYTLSFQINAKNGGNIVPNVFLSNTVTLVIDPKHPEKVFYKDFTPFEGSVTSFELTSVSLSAPTYGVNFPVSMQQQLANAIKVNTSVEKCYAIAANSMTCASATIVPVSVSGKQCTFSWNVPLGCKYPNWEFQLLKLYNIGSDPVNKVEAELDWAKALIIETYNNQSSLTLSLNEGSGYYAWRVRPIGNQFEGGYGNINNFGNFIVTFPQSIVLPDDLNDGNTVIGSIFNFTDVDEGINWIHSRSFAEQNKISESIQYANGLEQVKQSQVYLVSKNARIVSQSIYDYSARPSLSPLPLPEDNQKLAGYKTGVALNTSGNIYNEDNFDANAKLNNPDPMAGPVNSYYNGSTVDNTNYPIPDAGPGTNGYPYTRTTFYGDGTDRHKESSGVGYKNMISTNSASGKTVKTYYASTTDIELVRIFGDEAPSPKTVTKIIVVDPNGTTTITYKNTDGKVIATCLAYSEADDPTPPAVPALLDIYDEENPAPEPIDAVDVANENTTVPNGFASSSRMSLSQETPVSIQYTYNCNDFNSCLSGPVECSYQVQFKIHDLDNPSDVTRNFVFDPVAITCTDDPVIILKPDYTELVGSAATAFTVTGTTPNLGITFPSGNFLVEKILTYSSAVGTTVSNNSVSETTKFTEFVNILNCVISKIEDEASLQQFYADMASFDPYSSAHSTCNDLDGVSGCDFDAGYFDGISVSLNIPVGETKPTGIKISRECCGDMNVPMNFGDAKRFDCSGYASLESYEDGGSMDFYGHVVAQLGIGDAITMLPMYGRITIGGVEYSEYNIMIYHMLNDEYYTGRTIKSSGVLHKLNDDGTVGDALTSTDYTTQYKCDEVWNCWINTVSMVEQLKASVNQQYPDGEIGNVNDQTVEQNGSEGEGEQDENYDEGSEGSPLIEWFSGLLSPKMKDKDAAKIKVELLDLFLQCTGYKFAGVVIKDCNGNIKNPGAIADYFPADANPPLLLTTGHVSLHEDGPCSSPASQPDNTSFRPVYVTTEANGYLHETLFDRIYAFKYFEYVDPCYFPVTDDEGKNNSEIEIANCLYSNTTTYPYPLCRPSQCGTNGYETWSANQRLSLFLQLQTYPKTAGPEEGYALNNTPCGEGNAAWAAPIEAACTTACQARKSDIRTAVVGRLNERCYVINGCGTDAITPAQIEQLVQMLIDNCVALCDIESGDIECDNITCTAILGVENCIEQTETLNYRDIRLKDCKQMEIDQAKYWNVEVDFPTKCITPPAPNNPMFTSSPPAVIANGPQCDDGQLVPNFNAVNGGRKSPISVFTLNGE